MRFHNRNEKVNLIYVYYIIWNFKSIFWYNIHKMAPLDLIGQVKKMWFSKQDDK